MNKKTRKREKEKDKEKDKDHKKHIYTKDDYNSGDGMLTSVWGPSLWHFLHTMSFNYPVVPTDEEKKYYHDFIISLQHVLPCKYCRINLKSNFKQLPLTMTQMKNRESFSHYIYELHELINKMLHKKSGLTFCDVQDRYEHFRARCTAEKPTVFKFSNTKKNKTVKNKTVKNKKDKKEKGCTEPMYGKKSKCIIKIVPQEERGSTFQMDKKCVKSKE